MTLTTEYLTPVLYLLGALIFVKILLKLFFPHILNFIMKTVHSKIILLKEKLFEEAFKQISTGSQNLEILEIGIGTGENFKNFPKNAHLTILDKTDEFLPFLKKSINENKRDDLKISKLVVNYAENMESIESASMDAVVHTFILCSVKDSDKVLSEIQRVLKPGGICVFIEHSIDNKVDLFILKF